MAISENAFKYQLGVPPGKPIPDWKKKAALSGKYGKLTKEWAQELDNDKEEEADKKIEG